MRFLAIAYVLVVWVGQRAEHVCLRMENIYSFHVQCADLLFRMEFTLFGKRVQATIRSYPVYLDLHLFVDSHVLLQVLPHHTVVSPRIEKLALEE